MPSRDFLDPAAPIANLAAHDPRWESAFKGEARRNNLHILTGFHRESVGGDKIIVEIKAWKSSLQRTKTYVNLADKRLGLLINFNVALIEDVITRIVNGPKAPTGHLFGRGPERA